MNEPIEELRKWIRNDEVAGPIDAINGAIEAHDALRAELEKAVQANHGWIAANCKGGWIDDLRESLDTERARVEVMKRALVQRGVHRFDCPARDKSWTPHSWREGRDNKLCKCELGQALSPDAPNVLLERLREAEREVSCCKRAIRLFMESCYTDADNYVGGIYKLKFEDILSATPPTTNDNRRGEK